MSPGCTASKSRMAGSSFMHPVKYRFADFEADLKAAELRRNGIRLKLQMQPFQVLVALLERPKEVVTREELRQRLWPEDTFVDFDHGLNTAMAKLRDALGDSAARPRYVETIAKRGYRFLAEVTRVLSPAAPVQSQPSMTEQPASSFSVPGIPAREATTDETTDEMKTAAARTLDVSANAGKSGDQARDSAIGDNELPRASRTTARLLFVLSQIMYLVFYLAALFDLRQLAESSYRAWHSAGHAVFVVYLVTSLVGVAVRLYLITATSFDYHLLGRKYRILFPALFLLDMLWALSPLLIADRIGLGLALGATAALIYMPFAQRVLMQMTVKNRM
jgi:DNA-binding winged helix-turn-helix (wHTH) protein